MRRGVHRRTSQKLAGMAVIGLALAGCSVTVNEDGGGSAAGGGGGGSEGAADMEENTGSVSISGAGTGVDADAVQTVADAAAEGEDFTATYTGSDSFEQEIVIQVEGGTPPDIGLYPQPGAVVEQAEQGNAVALEDLGFEIADLEALFGEYLMSLGEYEGKHYGMPLDVNYKSAIWYNVPAWEEAGWGDPPTTWEEMIALSDEMVADGTAAPWCIGTGSDAATGWPATDWMENIVLRDQGTDVYDQWVDHEILFDSPEITSAAERFGEILFTDGYVFGGHENISGTDFRDAPDPMFGDDPGCWMHAQATFIPAFFPEGLTAIEDYSFFNWPDINGNSGTLMAGGLGAVFNARPEVLAFLENYIAAENQCLFGSTESTTISANFNVELDCYENEIIRQAAEPLQAALEEGVARFDGSDLMPPSVGSGEFWNGMNNYTDDGPDNLQSVLQSIDAAWPEGDGSSSASESEG